MCQEQKLLIGQLEDDLRKVNALSVMFRGDAEGEPSQSTELVAEAVKDSQVSEPGKVAAADSLLPIMHGQRERYRQRAQELETELLASQQRNLLQQNEMDRIRTDNIKLYEKIKFLQNYSSNRAAPGPTDETEARYSEQYEQKLDPFTNFNKKERNRRYGNLKLHEKITLGIGRFVMGSAAARTFAFVYAMLLHLLVFLCLYKMANMDTSDTQQCEQSFAEHMLAFHQDGHNHKI
ncbi:protein CASP-like [Watersipora subatra]|uniref:protein CASP-like n=1 Tax=Watersipora subatra TaxID=2589382 RepID=UPI00355C1E32